MFSRFCDLGRVLKKLWMSCKWGANIKKLIQGIWYWRTNRKLKQAKLTGGNNRIPTGWLGSSSSDFLFLLRMVGSCLEPTRLFSRERPIRLAAIVCTPVGRVSNSKINWQTERKEHTRFSKEKRAQRDQETYQLEENWGQEPDDRRITRGRREPSRLKKEDKNHEYTERTRSLRTTERRKTIWGLLKETWELRRTGKKRED